MNRVVAAGTMAVAGLLMAGTCSLARPGPARTATVQLRGAPTPAAPAVVVSHVPSPSTPTSSPTAAAVPPPPAPTAARSGPVAQPVSTAAAPVAGTSRGQALAAALMTQLGAIPAGWKASARTLTSGGLERVYMVLQPETLSYAAKVPVVVVMPGRGMSPDQLLHQSKLAEALAASGPAVLVAPAGWKNTWDAGDCCSSAYLARVDDVTFIRTVVNAVLRDIPQADKANMYAVGFSNGGRMAYRLGCDMPGAWRGFVAVEAVPVAPCRTMAPVGVTVVAQQNDPLLTVSTGAPKFVQGFKEPTVVDTVGRMSSLDRCPGAGAVANGEQTEWGISVEHTWSCAAGRDVRYVWYPGGGHNWRSPAGHTPGATDYVLQMMGRGPVAGLPPHSGA